MATWLIQDMERSACGQLPAQQVICDETRLRAALVSYAQQEPRILEVSITDLDGLHIGIGGPWAFLEHVVIEPWTADTAVCDSGDVEKPSSAWFVYAGERSEIPGRFPMPAATAIELILAYFRDGVLPTSAVWENS